MYQWLLYMDMNLFFLLAISFFNYRVKAAFWREICILPLKKTKQKNKKPHQKPRRKINLVAFPFCLSLSSIICTCCTLNLAVQHRMVSCGFLLQTPGICWEPNSPAQAAEVKDIRCQGIRFSLLNSPGMSHFMDECNNSCEDSHILKTNKQTTPCLCPLSCLKKKKSSALVCKTASYTYCLQGVERAFFGARYFKGKPVPV